MKNLLTAQFSKATMESAIRIAFPELTKAQIDELVNAANDYEDAEEILYNALGTLKTHNYQTALADTVGSKYAWGSSAFSRVRETRKCADQMIEKPPEIRDGDQECIRCKQKKVIVVEQQTRSADEGFTYRCICTNSKCRYIQTLG
jgi:DNA-directed RNA polymerase subunit M/transcription elongation factor TFIIS